MASALPVMNGREVVRVFKKLGWRFVRQKGSHMILVKTGEMVTLSVSDYSEVAKGTLPKSEWKAPSFSYGDEHGGGFSHLE
jgi:predicted RNA binding protein YcfA (HicA-like mRNA interferase family)